MLSFRFIDRKRPLEASIRAPVTKRPPTATKTCSLPYTSSFVICRSHSHINRKQSTLLCSTLRAATHHQRRTFLVSAAFRFILPLSSKLPPLRPPKLSTLLYSLTERGSTIAYTDGPSEHAQSFKTLAEAGNKLITLTGASCRRLLAKN